MKILVDANVLLRFVKRDHSDYQFAFEALSEIRKRGHVPCLVPQCLYEFYVVATRPIANNGLGLDSVQIDEDISELLAKFELLPDSPAIFPKWRELTSQYAVLGKTAHDARIVAAMVVHDV